MSSRQNESWRNQYHAVEEFELPKERDRFLPPPSSPTMDHQHQQPSPPPPAHQPPQQQPQQPQLATSSSSSSIPTVQHRNSRSFPSSPLNPQGPTGRPSTSSGGSHQNHPSGKPLPRSPSSASAPLSSSSHPPVSSPFGSLGRPGSRGSFTLGGPTPASPTGGSVNGRSGLGISGTQTPTTELLAAHHSFVNGALPTVGSRGSMILYRRADSGLFSPPISGVFDGSGGRSGTATPVQVPVHTGVSGMSGMSEDAASHAGLLPPQLPFSNNRSSVYSTSGESSLYGVERGLVAYAYDPDEDDESDDEEGDWLHDPAVAYPGTSEAKAQAAAVAKAGGAAAAGGSVKGKGKSLPRLGVDPQTGRKITDPAHPLYIPKPYIAPRISWRGLVNIGTLVAMVASLLCLFVVYPMVRFYADDGKNGLITGNLRINSTGQAEYVPGEEPEDDGSTPTSTRPPRTTVTAINPGGNVFDRRAGGPVWRREVDDWAVEFPAPSYNLNFFGSGEKPVEVVEVVDDTTEVGMPEEVVQLINVCIPPPTATVPLVSSSQEEERKRRLESYLMVKGGMRVNAPAESEDKGVEGEGLEVKVEFGVGEGIVEGLYSNGAWTFLESEMLDGLPSPFELTEADDDEEEEEEDEDGWELVKKHLSPASRRLSIRLVDWSSGARVSINNVFVRSPQDGMWQLASASGCEDAEDVVEVEVGAGMVRTAKEVLLAGL